MSAAKLLLVEDDPALSELLEYRFSNEGYHVRCTADGDEALILAAEELPDLIILDIGCREDRLLNTFRTIEVDWRRYAEIVELFSIAEIMFSRILNFHRH